MNIIKTNMEEEKIIKNIIINIKSSIHNIKYLQKYLFEYIFIKLKLPINSINHRLFEYLQKVDATYLIEDLNNYLITLPKLTLNRINKFLIYIIANRNNPNISLMVHHYNY